MSHLVNTLPPHLQPNAMPNSVPQIPPHLISQKNDPSQAPLPRTVFDEKRTGILAARFESFLNSINRPKSHSNGSKPTKAQNDKQKKVGKEVPVKKKIAKKKGTPKSKGQSNMAKVNRETEQSEQNHSQQMEELFTEISWLIRKSHKRRRLRTI